MAEVPADLKDRIKAVLVERLFLDIDPATLDPAESLTEAHGVDSVRLFDMVVGLEEDFDISFEDEELVLDAFDTVNAVAERVQAKLEGQ